MSNKRKSLTNSEMAMLTQGSELIERNTKRSWQLSEMQLRVEINYKGAIRPLINQPIAIKPLSLYKSHPGHQAEGGGEEQNQRKKERLS
jgi:hypothetical protein